MKKALVYEWFDYYSGAEKCVESFLNIWPDLDIYSIIDTYDNATREIALKGKKTTQSFISRLPFAKKHFRNYFFLFPAAVEQFDVTGYDLVFSHSHAFAKGVITSPHQLHICYCHSPIRYAWELYHQYLKESGLERGIKSVITRWMMHKIRIWDYTTANRADHLIANSHYTAARIKKIYNRPSEVIYPPVDINRFNPVLKKDDYYVTAGRFVQYKKIEMIVEAFSHLPEKKLVVIGDGPEMENIRKKAGKNVEIIGYAPDDEFARLISKARCFIYGALEDFGIIVVEALSAGTPVIAYNRGGTAETVRDGINGVHFSGQDVPSLLESIKKFESIEHQFDYGKIAAETEYFSKKNYEKRIREYTDLKLDEFSSKAQR